jgi:enterochelin esterase-like enzyme
LPQEPSDELQITNYSEWKDNTSYPALCISLYFPIFETMEMEKPPGILTENTEIKSEFLNRSVKIDFYLALPVAQPGAISLLLINDGQDLEQLGFETILRDLNKEGCLAPVLCAGIHAGTERKMEYGTAGIPDYKGRGAKAKNYSRFILEELIPYIRSRYGIADFKEKAFAGFSLGGLSALDTVWNHPQEFSKAGVFSGSLWWRTKDKSDKTYQDASDRIMHQQVRNGHYYPWLKFFFECGAADEEEDRNHNGIIDSIDDTLDLIRELTAKGYHPGKDIHYLQIEDGKHDIATWARALPEFLKWGWGK